MRTNRSRAIPGRAVAALVCLAIVAAASTATARVPKQARRAAAKAKKAAKAGMHRGDHLKGLGQGLGEWRTGHRAQSAMQHQKWPAGAKARNPNFGALQ